MKSKQVFDENLFQALCKISPYIDEAEWLKDHIRIRHEEREKFLNNEIENPHFTYSPQKSKVDYLKLIEEFNQCLKDSDVPAVVVDLYQRKLEKQLHRNALIEASLAGDDHVFFERSSDIYGRPQKKYFSYVAKRLLTLCNEQKSKYPVISRRLRKVVSKINQNGIDIDVSMLPPLVTNGRLIRSVDEVRSIFIETLSRCGIEGWIVSVDKAGTRGRFSVSPQSKTIHIPCESELLSRPQSLTDHGVQALAEHEVGVHVRRSYEASKGPLRLLEIGLDNYLPGEEGLASYAQQQVEGADEFYGFDRYLAASLAVGMDGEVRDFRSVFSLMSDYYTLKFALEDKTVSIPFQAAWDICVRIFRGTTGQTPGCIFTKDIVYMKGNIGIWNLLSERPKVFESLFIGKYNPLLSRHVKTLQTLDILEEW
ncbi:DUF1704 domain-containing protein [Candidatus Kaiserbacteria bacterium]|nr:DUF1704 domain-containing protein [Candidatus Kaiserbacteria bacterium]USN91981.1 MAG: DUF1704 domain-containing protein [Candidatus Nomurabacteria bacterium]